MSGIAKKEQHEQEREIYQARHEAGLQSLRAWLFRRRDEIAESWMELTGEELSRLQGEAKLIKKQLKMIDVGPTIKGDATS